MENFSPGHFLSRISPMSLYLLYFFVSAFSPSLSLSPHNSLRTTLQRKPQIKNIKILSPSLQIFPQYHLIYRKRSCSKKDLSKALGVPTGSPPFTHSDPQSGPHVSFCWKGSNYCHHLHTVTPSRQPSVFITQSLSAALGTVTIASPTPWVGDPHRTRAFTHSQNVSSVSSLSTGIFLGSETRPKENVFLSC